MRSLGGRGRAMGVRVSQRLQMLWSRTVIELGS